MVSVGCIGRFWFGVWVSNALSNKKKIGILENEYCALKSSLEREQGDLKSLSSIERSIESLEDKVDRIKNEDIHDIKDDISFLKSWLKNVGKIATSTRDKLNPSMDD